MQGVNPYHELVPVPLAAVELPLPLPVPAGFDPERLDTWPDIEGTLEYVQGRLLYMPPTGDLQQDTCADVAGVLQNWRRAHRDFVVGANEAGIKLGNDTRGADAAVWRRSTLSEYDGGLRRTPPVLVVEVAGKYDTEENLRDKAAWYLAHGSAVVWLLFPLERHVIVMTGDGETRRATGERLPLHPALPDLEPSVEELFEQVSERPK